MSLSRHIPVLTDPPPTPLVNRTLYPHSDFWDPVTNSFREMSLRDPFFSRDYPLIRDMFRDPAVRDPIRDTIVRDPVRDTAVYNPPPVAPLTRSFFNPERQLATMDSEMQRMADEMKRMVSDVQSLMPRDGSPESWRHRENYLLDNPVHQDRNTGHRTFKLQFDVRQFKPDEIYVTTVGNQLTIHAKHEEKADGKSLLREYHRQYVLPEDLNPEQLVSKLNHNGFLTVEAPLPALEGPRERLIPIKHN